MLKIRQIHLPIQNYNDKNIRKKIMNILNIKENEIVKYKISKLSVDARDKKNVFYVLELIVNIKNENKILENNKNNNIIAYKEEKYLIPRASNKLKKVIVVGSGPAGLFASYLLCKSGFKPIIIERGKKIEERILDVENFWNKNELQENSNVQFGEGGAGTFSDGKLNTLVNDKYYRNEFILETFVKFGAPKDIMYLQKPHIGTDILRQVIVNMRKEIIKLGGEFHFSSCLTDICYKKNKLEGIIVNNKEKILCDNLIIAIGHSARDTFSMLNNKGLQMEAKPFAVGIRIMHNVNFINESQYGPFAKYLSPASYKLTYTTKKGRGVYSFCMCPGGYVVNASSEKEKLVINGMSNYKRDSKSSNSAIVVNITPKDFGTSPMDGIEFQRKLESNAFKIGNGYIPVCTYKDYYNNKITSNISIPDTCGKTKIANLNEIFPSYINESLKEGIENFNQKIKGFGDDKAIVLGVESRTSSPVRILRDSNYESNIKGIFPCGEGAGYAGGIMTAAMDGMKVAEVIISK